MKLSEIDVNTLDRETAQKILFDNIGECAKRADLIMVLGSKKACDYRVPVAARLYSEGRAPYMLFCGGQVQETSYGKMKECEAMRRAALETGLPGERIFLEDKSTSTVENFTLGREVIRQELPECKSIILVTAPYHMRRALLLCRKLMGEYEISPCCAEKGSAVRDKWHLTEKGRKTVLDECAKFGYYIRVGLIDDEDI